MKNWNKPHHIQFWVGMGLYVAFIFLYSFVFAREMVIPTAFKFAVGLLPTTAMLFVVRATINNVMSMDEMEQRIHLEAVVITALLTGTLTFGYGLLENVDLVPDFPLMIVLPMMFALWGVANAIVRRRYV